MKLNWQTKKFELAVEFLTNHTSAMIWLIFSVLFLFMAWKELQKSKKPLESLKSSLYKQSNNGVQAIVGIMGVDFGKFTEELEKSNQESHLIAATSYLLAGLTAVAGLILSLL